MTEAEWAACREPEQMLAFVRGFAVERKARLFVIACCRQLLHRFAGNPLWQCVEVAERFADRLASSQDLALAYTQARRLAVNGSEGEIVGPLWCAGWYTDPYGGAMAHAGMRDAPAVLALAATDADGWAGAELCLPWAAALGMDRPTQAAVLRDVVHAPYRAVHFKNSWRLWRNGAAYRLAEEIYQGQHWDALPQLADALCGAGCDNEEMQAHLNDPGPHVRGCWVVDLLLNRA
jgi:hypothetical protein